MLTVFEELDIPLSINIPSIRGREIFLRKEHVVLGISPFNSYYTEKRIYFLIKWAAENFKSFDIFVPDKLPIYTFLSMGMSAEKSEKKTRRQVNYLLNKINHALNEISDFLFLDNKKKIIKMEMLEENNSYKKTLSMIYSLYQNDKNFFNFCTKFTEQIVFSKNIEYFDVNIAVNYFLKELPILINSPEIINVNTSLFMYHSMPKLLYQLYSENLFQLVSSKQDFICVEFK